MQYPELFTQLKVGVLAFPNRIIMAPLTRSRAGLEHIPNEMMASPLVITMSVIPVWLKKLGMISRLWNPIKALTTHRGRRVISITSERI